MLQRASERERVCEREFIACLPKCKLVDHNKQEEAQTKALHSSSELLFQSFRSPQTSESFAATPSAQKQRLAAAQVP